MHAGESRRPLSEDEVARLAGQIAGLSTAGVPLAPGLRAAAEELHPGRLRSALAAVADAIDAGATVEEAVAARGARLPGYLRGLVVIGARTGKLGVVLGRFVDFVGVGTEIRRQLWVRLAYPALLLGFAFGVIAFVSGTLVAAFENIFRDFGVPLPGLTMAILAASHVVNLGSRAAARGLVGLLVFWLLAMVFMSRTTRRSLAARIPLLGVVWRNTALAEFCHLLALLLEGEVPLGEAIVLTGEGVRDSRLTRASGAMSLDVKGGLTLSQAVQARPVFPRGLARVLRWAEGHQSLPEALHTVGEMFEARARAQAEFAGFVIGVLAVLTVLLGVAVVVIGLFLPMFTLISRLSG